MLERCRRLRRHVATVATLDEFVANEIAYDAVLRNLEIIGEAAGRVSEETQERLSHLPWRAIIAFRHVLAHNYAIIDDVVVWEITHNQVVELQRELEKCLDENAEGE